MQSCTMLLNILTLLNLQNSSYYHAHVIQWCSQKAEKVTHIKGRLLGQAVILFN